MKDGCNNMEKNKIIHHHKNGVSNEDISRHLHLTPRIVESIIGHYCPDPETASEAKPDSKPTKKKAKKKAKKKSAKDDFDD